MKRTILIFLALCGLLMSAMAQKGAIPVRIEEVRGNDQYYGFILHDGTVVVQPKYIEAHEFSEGLAAVMDTNHRWSFINTAGKRVFILPSYVSKVGDFSEGLCWFRNSNTDLVGFVDRTGKVVIRPQWNFAHNFSDGLAAVGNGRTLGDPWFEIGNLLGYINHKGEMVIPLDIHHDNYGNENFHCQRAIIETDDRLMIIDTKGNELFGGIYRSSFGEFSEGLCTVATATNAPCDADHGDHDLPPCKLHWCVIDTAGRVVIDDIKATEFHEGMAKVDLSDNPRLSPDGKETDSKKRGDFVFVDTTGKVLFDRKFKDAEYFSEGVALVEEMDGTTGFISHKGEMELALPKDYVSYICNGFKHGLITIFKSVKKGKYTYYTDRTIDRKGNIVWEIRYYSWFD